MARTRPYPVFVPDRPAERQASSPEHPREMRAGAGGNSQGTLVGSQPEELGGQRQLDCHRLDAVISVARTATGSRSRGWSCSLHPHRIRCQCARGVWRSRPRARLCRPGAPTSCTGLWIRCRRKCLLSTSCVRPPRTACGRRSLGLSSGLALEVRVIDPLHGQAPARAHSEAVVVHEPDKKSAVDEDDPAADPTHVFLRFGGEE